MTQKTQTQTPQTQQNIKSFGVTVGAAIRELPGNVVPCVLCSPYGDGYVSISCLFKRKISLGFGTVCELSIKAANEKDS